MKVLILKGLPASGKTTYAKQLVAKGWKRINKDDLRAMIDDSKWSRNNEKFVLQLRDVILLAALRKGYSVVIDDTNLHLKHREQIKNLVHKFNQESVDATATVSSKTFDTEPEVCIERDLKRANSVGAKVIWGMYDQFIRPPAKVYEPPKNKPKAIIVDIDGTLAHMVDRSPYDPTKYHEDIIDETVREIVNRYFEDGVTVLLCSGRDVDHVDVTTKWLEGNGVKFHQLLMRPSGDIRKDAEVKQEIYENHIKSDYEVLFVLDDRNRVVQMWREQGLKVLQVAEGDF